MKTKEIIINTNQPLFEAAYPGNIGLMELVQFYKVATPEQKKLMDKITAENDWEQFKHLIHQVLNVKLV